MRSLRIEAASNGYILHVGDASTCETYGYRVEVYVSYIDLVRRIADICGEVNFSTKYEASFFAPSDSASPPYGL